MPTWGLTSAGFYRPTYAEVLTAKIAAYKAAYGDAFVTTADGTAGTRIRLDAEREASMWEAMEAVYQATDPNQAGGVPLDNNTAIVGVVRNLATSTTAAVTLTGTPATSIAAGKIVENSTTGDRYTIDATVAIGGGGTVAAAVTCTATGPIEADIGTIDQIVTPVSGWTAVTNAEDATPGQVDETDDELRTRRLLSLAAGGNGTGDSTRAAVLDLDWVVASVVYQNRTSATDADGRPANTFEVVIQTADGTITQPQEDALVAVIFDHTPDGITSYGDDSGTVESDSGTTETVYYKRATAETFYTRLTSVTLSDGSTSLTTAQKAVLTRAQLEAYAGAAVAADLDDVDAVYGTIGTDIYYEVMRAAVFGAILDGGVRIIWGTYRIGTSIPAAGTTNIVVDVRETGKLNNDAVDIAYT